MSESKRVLICEYHQETNTFNPIPFTVEAFRGQRCTAGRDAYETCRQLPCAFHGMIDAVEAEGWEVIPSIAMYSGSGGRVSDESYRMLLDGVRQTLAESGPVDALFASLHGATCAESEDDVCGAFLAYARELIGEDKIIAASFDLHGNITEKILKNADVICGYHTYPHVDHYETGLRAGRIGVRKMLGKPAFQASTIIPMMVPPSGFTTMEGPFKQVMDYGKSLVADGTLLDFSLFQVQPWLDIPNIGSTVTAIAEDPDTARTYTDILAQKLYMHRDEYWPELTSIDAVIDRAEDPASEKPVILVDSADSTNGGAVGDSVAAALALMQRGSKIRCGMFVKDPEAAAKAFEVGVGNTAEFSVGAKLTPNMPGPLVGMAKVCSLHDGDYWQEGPANKGLACHAGKSAVLRFGTIDIMVCEEPAGSSGDPQLLRHFGIEPTLYDLIVVKANTSYRASYGRFATEMYPADTPGAGASNLKRFEWKHLPRNFYPFDLDAGYTPAPAALLRER